MRILTLLDGDIGELTPEQQTALNKVIRAFNGTIKQNVDIEQVLNCEFCMGGK